MSEKYVQKTPRRIPETNFSFADAQGNPQAGARHRINLRGDSEYVMNHTDRDTLVENELRDRRVFIDALQRVLSAQGPTIDAEATFKDVAHYYTKLPDSEARFSHVFGSQHLIEVKPFDEVEWQKKESTRLGPPETTTRYGFVFDLFTATPPIQDSQTRYGVAYYTFDEAPLHVLQKYGVTSAVIAQYFEGFSKMASMAEHDYLHQLLSQTEQHSNYRYPPLNILESSRKHPPPKKAEVHALALHARVCQEIFSEVRTLENAQGQPVTIDLGARRKKGVLRWAEDTFTGLADMQDDALSRAHTDADKAAIKEAITYLAEVYAHRLFRVISPRDAALTDSDSPVVQVADRIRLQTPHTIDSNNEQRNHGMNGLRHLCETFMGRLYNNIHSINSVRINEFKAEYVSWVDGSQRPTQHRLTLPQVVDAMVAGGMPAMKQRYADQELARAQTGGASTDPWKR